MMLFRSARTLVEGVCSDNVACMLLVAPAGQSCFPPPALVHLSESLS
jgi:hypothetical protein